MRDEQKTLDFCARLAICLCGLHEVQVLHSDADGTGSWQFLPKGLGNPVGGDGGFGAAVPPLRPDDGVGPRASSFPFRRIDEDSSRIRAAGRCRREVEDGVLLGAVEDAVDEDGEVGAQEREVDAEFAEGGGRAGLETKCGISWPVMAAASIALHW